MAEPFLGEITLFAGNFAPRNWTFCAGQLLPIAQNAALFSILGTTYGGDGETTFALPDLRGRTPRGFGQGPGLDNVQQGQKAGNFQLTLTSVELPSHNHPLDNNANSGSANDTAPGGNAPAETADDIYSNSTANVRSGPAATENSGSGQPFDVLNPYLGLNYIIALQGVYPTE